MTDQIQGNAEKSISDRLLEILPQLTTNQLRYIVARQECATDGEAAEVIGVKPDTVYRWPEIVKEAARLMAGDGVFVAREMRRRALPKAMAVKVAGLDSNDERLRQNVATELIEWELGTATRKTDVTTDGKPIVVIGVGVDVDAL